MAYNLPSGCTYSDIDRNGAAPLCPTCGEEYDGEKQECDECLKQTAKDLQEIDDRTLGPA